MSLEGKVAVVTGGGGLIGRAIADVLAQDGAAQAGTARNHAEWAFGDYGSEGWGFESLRARWIDAGQGRFWNLAPHLEGALAHGLLTNGFR